MGANLMPRSPGPRLQFSDHLHQEKYRLPGEDYAEKCIRVAKRLCDTQWHYQQYVEMTQGMRFLEAGRIQAAMGAPKAVTPYNCYVSGTIEDSFVEGEGSIMQRATEAAQTLRLGGGIGYDFSTLRHNGALIKKLLSYSTGPVSFMGIYNAICLCIASAGHRRGAQMGVLRIDHPDIEEFIEAKGNADKLTGFNISVAVTDEFMHCLEYQQPFHLRWKGEVIKTVDPETLWAKIMSHAWDWAEPGVIFIDTINRMNNLWYCETIASTNPCGEQPLPPHGACLLGSFNLAKYIKPMGLGLCYDFDWELLRSDVPLAVRALDNVIDQAIYPLPAQETEAKSKRRMGLGITGLANAAEAMGFSYGSNRFLEFELGVLEVLRDEAYRASVELAKEKGPFELFDAVKYGQGQFIKTLPEDIRFDIARHGIRNSHLTSIAPTGTISFCADYVSSGIEPVFEYEATRTVNMPNGVMDVDVSDYAYREWGVKGKLAADVTAQEHIEVLAVAAAKVDSAVSKTCNVDGTMEHSEFQNLYRQAWRRGAKGCTTFNKDGKRMGIMVKAEKEEAEDNATCFIDPETGRRDCS